MSEEVMNTDVVDEELATEELEDVVAPDDELDETGDNLVEEPEETPDLSSEFLKNFKITYDGEEVSYDNVEDLVNDAQKGRNYQRVLDQRDALKKDPGYQFMQKYMKDSGYKDMSKFVHDLSVQRKADELINKGMSEADAKAEAENFIKNVVPDVDPKDKAVSDFLNWHESKFGGELKEVPQSVLDAYDKGQSLKEAFLEYKLDNAKVETEQQTLKNLKKNKETSSGELHKGKTKQVDMTASQVDKLMSSMTSKQQSEWADKNYEMLERIRYYDR